MKRWWDRSEAAFGDLVDGLAHLNRRTDDTIIADYQRYVAALTRLAKGYCSIHFEVAERSDKASHIRNFVRDAAMWRPDDAFFDGRAFRKFLQISQEVAVEDALRKARHRLEFAAADLAEAGETRANFVLATSVYDAGRDPEAALNVGYWLGALLYAMRPNLDRGEKPHSGPEAAEAERDEQVLSAALPVVKDLALRTLDHPQYRLAVYGSLRAGQPNHHHIADLGVASYGSVSGTIVQRDSYPVFSWNLAGDEVPVEVYFTTRLTPEKWAALNDFEGDGYRPVLCPVRDKTTGERVVATIYADVRS